MKNNGMESQKKYLDYLKDVMANDINFVIAEFVDTRKARNFVGPNPSDFFGCYKATPWLIEIKSSIDCARFPMKNIKGTQFGIGRRYRLSGWKYMFIIHQKLWNYWYFVPFDFVFDLYSKGHRSIKWEALKPFLKHKTYNFWENEYE